MPTKIEIYNRALQKIQGIPVESLTEDTEQRRVLDGVYDSVRREVLIDHLWTFAFRDTQLSAVDLPEVYDADWQFAYAYPADCLQLNRVYAKGGRDCGHWVRFVKDELEQESRIILTNESDQALVSYVTDVSNTGLFTPLFTETLVNRLAAAIVTPLTGNVEAQGFFLQQYSLMLAKAEKSDSEDIKPVCPPPEDSFVLARMGSGINECPDSRGSAGNFHDFF